jgi:hypothetical protein
VPDRIKAIVLSDLHLGERTSAFSEGEIPDVRFRGRTAEHLARLLGALLATQDGRAEYLVLAGDVLDLSLASRRAAFLGFKSFLEQIAPLFDTLIYVPGNHDHHIWVALQEEARIFAQIRQGQPVLPYYDAFVPAIEPGGLVLPLLAGSEDQAVGCCAGQSARGHSCTTCCPPPPATAPWTSWSRTRTSNSGCRNSGSSSLTDTSSRRRGRSSPTRCRNRCTRRR